MQQSACRCRFCLWQIWAFVSPGLYPHERAYVTPFIALSSISFVLGAMFAYKVIFPPAAKYLLGLGPGFSAVVKGRRLFRFHHHRDAGNGHRFPNAGRYLRIGPNWAGYGRVSGANLEDGANRDSDFRRRAFADKRHSEHASVCRADGCAVLGVDIRRLDI